MSEEELTDIDWRSVKFFVAGVVIGFLLGVFMVWVALTYAH